MRDAVRYQYYDTSDDRIILFQASERHFFERFCRAVGREDLLEGDLGEEFGEHASGDLELRRELAGIFATRTQQEWVDFLLEVDVPGAPVHRVPELPEDPNFIARADIVAHDHPIAGPLTPARVPDQDRRAARPHGPRAQYRRPLRRDPVVGPRLRRRPHRPTPGVRHRRVVEVRPKFTADQALMRSVVVVRVARSASVLSRTALT